VVENALIAGSKGNDAVSQSEKKISLHLDRQAISEIPASDEARRIKAWEKLGDRSSIE
jgi:hypothetical protein